MAFLNLFVTLLVIGVAVAEPLWYNSPNGRKYLIEGEAKYNWFKAEHECSRRNLQLVEIQAQSKNQDLVQLLKSIFGTSRGLWLGGNDQFHTEYNTKRSFYWSASGKSMTFSNWYPGEPNNEGNQEHCVHTFAYSPNFEWNDVSCGNKYGFICEEQQSHSEYLAALKEKRQTVMKTIKQFAESVQHEQEKVLEIVQGTRSLIAKNHNEVDKFLEAVSNQASHDSEPSEVNPVSDETNQQISHLNEKLETLIPKIYNKLSQRLNEAQQTIEQSMQNISL